MWPHLLQDQMQPDSLESLARWDGVISRDSLEPSDEENAFGDVRAAVGWLAAAGAKS